MEVRSQSGYLVIADISGYTSYLAATELEHAHEILSDLLEVIAGHLAPTLTVSKLEGDAVFTYAPSARLSRGATVLELIEATYMAFRDRRTSMRRQTTCECHACRAIPTLDLKFVAHHGQYLLQRVRAAEELVGADVALVHRLLKNYVSEATGWHAYALFTQACLERMGLSPEGLHAQTESYEHLGEVRTYSLDLAQRYQALVDQRRVVVDAAEADFACGVDVPVPPAVLWEWLHDPAKRMRAEDLTGVELVLLPGGRGGVGMRSHCAHGRKITVQTILDWRPHDYFTVEFSKRSGFRLGVATKRLTPTSTGTRLDVYFKIMSVPGPRWLRKLATRLLAQNGLEACVVNLPRLVAEDAANTADARPVPASGAADSGGGRAIPA